MSNTVQTAINPTDLWFRCMQQERIAPKSSTMHFPLFQGENGAVYIFYGGTSFPRGKATSNCNIGKLDPCPGEKVSTCILYNLFYDLDA